MGSGHAPGRLMVIGGGEDKEGEMEILREFVRLAGGPDEARIVVMSAASTDHEAQDAKYRGVFEGIGVREFRMLRTESRSDADRAQAVKAIDRATGIFFTGGDQKLLVSRLRETKIADELHRRLRDGLVIAGTSAGASMMSATMLDEGDSKECARKGIVTLGEGMGFLPGMIIDQHFAQRGRLGRLLAAVAERPDLLGVGIGEDTAMIVEGDSFRVIGRGVATVIDGSRVRYNDLEFRRKNEPLTLSGLTCHTVGLGHTFDVAGRQVIPQESEAVVA